MKRASSVAGVLLFGTSALCQPAVELEEPFATLSLAERMKHHGVFGVSIAVIDGEAIAWARGFGLADVERQIPVTAETLFQAASISKPVAAVAALKLVEDEKVQLDQNVNELLRSWRVPENGFTHREPVTLRRLLTHSAGLTVHGFPGYALEVRRPSLRQVLDGESPANTAAIRVDVEPGSLFRYSGGGYTVLQQLLTDVTGTSFPELLRLTVLEPLGMKHSTYEQPLPASSIPRAASAYREDGKKIEGGWHVYPEMAAAGLWTTPSDLARFAIEIQKSHRGESNQVLSSSMARAMLTKGLNEWGLGPALEGEGVSLRFGHGGANEGFRCQLVAYLHRGQGAVVMTNSDNGRALIEEILQAIAMAWEWPDFQPRD